MARGAIEGEVRVIGEVVPADPGPPRRSILIVAGMFAVAALGATFISHVGSDGIDASLITDPALQPDPVTTTTSSMDFGDPLPPIASPNPLDVLVPGFKGTLIMTTDSQTGLEVWTWSSGPNGTQTRDPVLGDLLDARPDANGEEVAALGGRPGDPPWLVVTDGSAVIPVFFGVQSFAWHTSAPGRIAWLSQTSSQGPPTLYVGAREDGGLYFKPVGDLAGFSSATSTRPPDRIVGYDDGGFVVETWSVSDGVVTPTVNRLDLSGRLLASLDGYFVGISADGGMAVSDVGTTTITSAAASPTWTLPTAATSAVWSPAGDRLATAADTATTVAIGTPNDDSWKFFDLGLDHPTVRAWSPDGRFVIASGYDGDDAVLVFIDTFEGSVRPIPIDVNPIGVVIIP